MADRILDILEAVALYGPATLDEITDCLPRSRSSVYRALVDLERKGWIRRSLNGRSFSVTSKMEELSDSQFIPSDSIGQVIDALTKNRLKCQISLILHVKAVEFMIVDSNKLPLKEASECREVIHALIDLMNEMRTWGMITRNNSKKHMEIRRASGGIIKELQKYGFVTIEHIETCLLPFLTKQGELVFACTRIWNYSGSGLDILHSMTSTYYEIISRQEVSSFKLPDEIRSKSA